jgi:hypothetical protein
MLLLITGASGVGKSSVRRALATELEPEVACVELGHVVSMPAWPTKAWRQESTEAVVRKALELQADGRHLLLSGDPVTPGEVLAAPSADRLDGIRACLLHADRESQEARLRGRGDPEALLPDHIAFAAWMRAHAEDPSHMPEVLTVDGWEEMRWERWLDRGPGDPNWNVATIDTSALDLEAVAAEALAWARASLRGETAPLAVSAPN